MRKLRIRFTKSSLDYKNVEQLKGFIGQCTGKHNVSWYCLCCSGEGKKEKTSSSEQVEELQTQTTNLSLQLHKQMEDFTGKM